MMDDAGYLYVMKGFIYSPNIYQWDRISVSPDGSSIIVVPGADMGNETPKGFNVAGHDGTRFVGGVDGDGLNYFVTTDPAVAGRIPGAISTITYPNNMRARVYDWTVVPSGAAGVLANYAGWMVGLGKYPTTSVDGTLILVNGETNQLVQETISVPISASAFGAAFTLGTDVYFVSKDGDMLVYDSTGTLSVAQTGLGGQLLQHFDDIDAAACTGVVNLVAASTDSTIAFDPNGGTGDQIGRAHV